MIHLTYQITVQVQIKRVGFAWGLPDGTGNQPPRLVDVEAADSFVRG